MPILRDRRLERSVVRRARVIGRTNTRSNAPRGHLLMAEVVRCAPGLDKPWCDFQQQSRVSGLGERAPVDPQHVIVDSVDACVKALIH